MIKHASLKIKFDLLQPWSLQIFADIRKEIKNEHLRKDRVIAQRYFAKKALDKLTLEEISSAYTAEIVDLGNQEVADYVISRWILKHAEVYEYFARELTAINPKFDQIDLLPNEKAKDLADRAIKQFGASASYIFCVLNSVALPDLVFEEMRRGAEQERALAQAQTAEKTEDFLSIEELRKKQEQEILKLSDKYEKKLQGVSKKYIQDVEGLKKQIGQLQRKIGELSAVSR